MKQKVVIKVSMHKQKCRSKAIAVGLSGVDSVALKGEDKSQIEIIGEGMDTVTLTTLLRKKVGYAEIVSVKAADKKDDQGKEKIEPLLWTCRGYSYQGVDADPYNNTCFIT